MKPAFKLFVSYLNYIRQTIAGVHRLAYNDDVAAGQLAVFQGASEAPIPPHFCLLLVWLFRSQRKNGAGRAERATRKNSQPAAARRVALKMGQRLRCFVGYVSL
jgi:hypothetical protein